MDVRLSAEQQALRDSAAQIVDRLGPLTVGQLDDTERAAKLDAAVVAAGWRELRTANEDGAPWASGVEVAIVAEELGRRLADTSLLGPTLAAELRRLAGAPAATAGETIALVPGLGELAIGRDGASLDAAVAVDAAGSTSALVLIPTADGHQLAEVALADGTAGVDLTRPSIAIATGTVVRPVDGQTRAITAAELECWTALGLALSCADLVGIMRGAVQLSCDYARERRQYGKPIGSFQAVQHMLADAYVLMEGSRSVTLHAAWAVDALAPSESVAAGAIAKAYCARAARTVCETAIQVHGGIGNTWECLAHLYLRRALLSGDVLGGAGANLARVLAGHGIASAGTGGHDGLR